MSRSMSHSFHESRVSPAFCYNAMATCPSHRDQHHHGRTTEEKEDDEIMSQPCLLHHSTFARAPSPGSRPFSAIYPAGHAVSHSTITVPVATRGNHRLPKLRSLDDSFLNTSLAGSAGTTARSSHATAIGGSVSQGTARKASTSECAGRCLLCLVLNALFIFGVFVAFLIGHWTSSAFMEEPANGTSPDGHPPVHPSPTNSLKIILNGSLVNDKERQQILYSNVGDSDPPLTIFDIYPPAFEESIGGERTFNMRLHRFSGGGDDKTSPPTVSRQKATAGNVPLPKSVLPTHYDLQLDFTAFEHRERIAGNVLIYLRSFGNATSAELVFHASANIFISRTRLHKVYSAESVRIKTVRRDLQDDLVRVVLAERLEANREYKLEVEFRAKICQSNVEGAYCFRSTILGQDNRTFVPRVTGFVTKFEPRLARTFLPCWDEPRVKTTFNVSIVHAGCYPMVLSNTPAVSQRPAVGHTFERGDKNEDGSNDEDSCTGQFVRTQFAMTPKMSVYLLAFAIGKYTSLEVRTSQPANMPLTIWAQPENLVAIHFAANFSPAMFERVEADFDVKYPIGKLDFVVVPNFPAGGMENWGLVVFHAGYFLSTWAGVRTQLPLTLTAGKAEYDRLHNNMVVDRAAEQYQIEKIITHEIVHQWFGNLMTMYEWEDLWLKEGFTTYFVFDLLNEAHPQLTEYEYYQNLIHLFNKQSSVASQALVRRPPAGDLFDSVALYTKGAVVVKMLKDLVGSRDFHTGITMLLKKFAYASVDEPALWSCLPTRVDHGAEQERLADIMYSWLYNDGVPEVVISRNYNDQSILIVQQPANLNRYAVFLNDVTSSATPRLSTRHARSMPTVAGLTDETAFALFDVEKFDKDEEQHGEQGISLGEMLQSLIDWRKGKTTTQIQSKSQRAAEEYLPGDKRRRSSCITIEQPMIGLKSIDDSTDANKSHGRSLESETTSTQRWEIRHTRTIGSDNWATTMSIDATSVPLKFDDALFSTTAPRKRVRGSIRKRLKHHKRKQSSTRRRNGGSAMTNRPTLTHAALTVIDLGRVPIFSADIRAPNEGRLKPMPSTSDTESVSQWEGGVARRLASIQSFEDTAPRSNESNVTRPKCGAVWWIPFSYEFGSARSSAGQTIRQFWLRNQTLRFVDVGLGARQYLLANPHFVYPYRVNYDLDNWQMIIEQLHVNHLDIPVMSRIQLIVDGEAYLRFSATPHLYVRLLSYLAKDTELGVLLVGLDALHALVDAFSGTRVAGALAALLLPAVRQLDQQLAAAAAGGGTSADSAALWLLAPLRLAKLYQLRCLCNLGTCAEKHQVSKWLAHPTALDAEHHQQITAICHFLFTQAGADELALLAGLLRQRSTQWSVLIQLAGCVRDDTLIRTAVEQILRTRNVVVYLSALKSGYSLQYNRRFRELFWAGVGRLSAHERRLLFAVNTGRSDRAAKHLLHSVRTVDELTRVEALLLTWPPTLRTHLEYLKRRLSWLAGPAADQLHSYMTGQ